MTAVNLALGTMLFGIKVPEETSFALLDQFVDAGGVWLDTADCYSFWADDSGHGGASERLLGRWLASRPGVRDRVRISTKVGAEPMDDGEWPANRQGLSGAAIATAVQGSLRRLGTDHLDLYWAHMEDRSVDLAETAEALAKLAADGTVGRLGASNHPLWRVERARGIARSHGWAEYTALQLRHSYFRPRPGIAVPGQNHRFGWATDETLDYVHSDPELTLWAYTTLLYGHYARPDRDPGEAYQHVGNERRAAALGQVADELGVTPNQVVLAWLTGGEPAVTPIVGVSRPEQLTEAIAGVTLELPAEHRALLDAAG
ncbi:aldo/keto reductase [Streptomyces sp. DSM 44915]|uniref:Aldo/keto reductase n=1 Tax=Streptomyces chisholmiae TaxID=3075540 RepID=A0ABU2JV22_9ACTN|nr:aldo/keto reductase [Streptomyces sp. DSM 44915]MDT0268817.1 aldo/keto reductase [Streptomyces sp. DSM 44915]